MQSVDKCFDIVKKDYLNFLKKENISSQSYKMKISNLKNFYIPMSFWIESKFKKKSGKTLILGFSGGQGSGKTTITAIIKIILKIFFKRKVYVSSIDDYYKTFKERKKMSNTIHPLFKTRGVPGTHDVEIIESFFKSLKRKKFKKIKLPKFNKATDDRMSKNNWMNIKSKPDIVIFEGWCVGAAYQNNSIIEKPINNLEKYEDPKMIWRKNVNQNLKKNYQRIFKMIDHYIFIKVPSFKMVYKWRLLQELKLKKKLYFKKRNKGLMSKNKIKRFIMFYERITLQMFKDLGKSASVVLFLKNNHQIKKVFYRF